MTASSEGFGADALDMDGAPERPKLPPAPISAMQRFTWSVRRELWENRSVFIAPLSVAGLILLGSVIGMVKLSGHMRPMESNIQGNPLVPIFSFLAFAIMVTSVLVAVFYCLGALHNERRDRSILFWKSLPVSDVTTVASKAAIPFAVIPVVTVVVAVALQLVLLVLTSIALQIHGFDVPALLGQLPVLHMWLLMIYGQVVLALWYAPVYGWLLLVSAWAKRAPFLWAVLPPLGLMLVEKTALSTAYVFHVVKDRLSGGFEEAFVQQSGFNSLSAIQPDPMRLLAAPDLWIGLVIGVALMAGAVWFRRNREPI